MKTFSEYKSQHNTLRQHFMLEFLLRDNIRNDFNNINEAFGVYNGQVKFVIDLCKHIIFAVSQDDNAYMFELNKKDLNEYDNVFFKHITVKYKPNITTGYAACDNYDEKTKLMNEITICIDRNEYPDYDSLVTCLCHELTHAFNAYNSYIKKSKSTLLSVSQDYSYARTLKPTKSGPVMICRRICNNIRKLEQNAYISELGTALETHVNDISNFNDALDIFKKTQVWKQYSIFSEYIDAMIEKKLDDNHINAFCDEYNDINNTTLTNEKVLKRLKQKLQKIFDKMNTLVPKIYYDFYLRHKQQNVDENMISGRMNSYTIALSEIIIGKFNTNIHNIKIT